MMRSASLAIAAILVVACGSTSVAHKPVTSASPTLSPSISQSATATPPKPTPTPTGAPVSSCGKAASGARTQSPNPTPPSPSPGTGSISGNLGFPAGFLAPQLVYAINSKGAAYGAAAVETVASQSHYTLEGVAPGTYFVYSVSRLQGSWPLACAQWGAIYSKSVPCGLDISCKDHTPIAVTVKSGQPTQNINPVDWYAPQGDRSFQPPPASIVWPADYVPTYGGFSTPRVAAEDHARGLSIALLVSDIRSCPVNRACVAVGPEQDGTGAAYFVGVSGSNGVLLQCGTYVYLSGGQWHGLAWRCQNNYVFPAVGRSGSVFAGLGASPTDCVNVRATAGLSGKVVGCVRNGSTVTLDGGPTYSPGKDINGLWWHVSGQGWISDNFLWFVGD